MNHIRWYKRDPNAALEGMAVLTLEERGAYNTILDLIYSHDGSVDDDDRFLAGWMRVDVRVWRRIRTRLLDLGKLYTYAGGDPPSPVLKNHRADREVDAALHRVASAAQAGLASASKRAVVSKNLNDLASTPVERAFNLPTPTPTKKETTSSILSRARVSQDATGLSTTRPSDLSRSEIEATFRQRKRNGGGK